MNSILRASLRIVESAWIVQKKFYKTRGSQKITVHKPFHNLRKVEQEANEGAKCMNKKEKPRRKWKLSLLGGCKTIKFCFANCSQGTVATSHEGLS
eukprot:303563-Pelagomonas_calceolata.AAC.2